MLNKNLEALVSNAVQTAVDHKHSMVTVEHLLLHLLETENVKRVLSACDVKQDVVKTRISEYITNSMNDLVSPDVTKENLKKTSPAFERCFGRAQIRMSERSQSEINETDMLLSIMNERSCYSYTVLTEGGLTRYNMINFLSHGVVPSENKKDDRQPILANDVEEDRPRLKSGNALEDFGINLNDRAAAGKIDPVIGRDEEIDQVLRILSRRGKSNPVLVGEAGVGKTAIAEGLALRIAEKSVPEQFLNMKVYSIDFGLMVAGTKYRGEYEERLKNLISQASRRDDVVLFIDEIHSALGTTRGSQSVEAANIFKPCLARGEIKCIGATTQEEYRRLFETDAAMARRFQKVDIKEPSRDDAIAIVERAKDRFETHYGISISHDAVTQAVCLSDRYIHARRLPDKAFDALDEAGSIMLSEQRAGQTMEISDVRMAIEKMSGVPVTIDAGNERDALKNMEFNLRNSVFGQEAAIKKVVKAVKVAKAGMSNPEKPMASFLFAGATGVGKTELTRRVGDLLGMEVLRFDMSEYSEKHSVAKLIGSPPGYLDSQNGGKLTEAVEQKPNSIVLLDEIEKAHSDVYALLLQVMDYGFLSDGQGRNVNFRNTMLIMTSNVGATAGEKPSFGFLGRDDNESDEASQEVAKTFSPEFRNRLSAVVHFNRLSKETIPLLVDKFTSQIERSLEDKRVFLELTDEAKSWIGDKGYDPSMGARPMERVIQEFICEPLADEILFGDLENGGNVIIDAGPDGTCLDLQITPAQAMCEAPAPQIA